MMKVRLSQRRRRSHARGYTVMEVMIALALLIIAASGVVAMQKVATYNNMRARNLAMANQIARTWVERLREDAVRWNYPSPNNQAIAADIQSDTVWLRGVENSPGVWVAPVWDGTTLRGPAFDALGNDLPPARISEAAFCSHIRLSWMYPNQVVRADIRVFWLREGGLGSPTGNAPFCSVTPTALDIPANNPVARFHQVYVSTSILQNTAQSTSLTNQ